MSMMCCDMLGVPRTVDDMRRLDPEANKRIDDLQASHHIEALDGRYSA